ncbi:hypothetical protein CsSME_00009388 [Camellia sinensis var. sinensis]
MVFDYPQVLGYFSMEEMKQKVGYLMEFGLGNEDVGRLLAFKPQLMACSIEERWKPLVKYLYYLGISKDGMRRILTIKPMVFCVDLESTIVPKVQFLRDIGVKEDAIGNMLVKFPPLLTYSLYKKIRPVVCSFLLFLFLSFQFLKVTSFDTSKENQVSLDIFCRAYYVMTINCSRLLIVMDLSMILHLELS